MSKLDIKREDIPIVSDSATAGVTTAGCGWLPSGLTSGNIACKSSTKDGNT